ncbi:MAG: carboxypeptidase-like regulatory domain-containing protein [Janthinobacterium lividum]
MPRLLLFLIFCGLTFSAQAQHRLAAARQRSYLTKVFRLSETQTRYLFEHGLQAARPAFFAVPVDSFPTDSVRPRPLPLGYYLVARAEGPQLVYWLRTETNRQVEVLDNQIDLALAVRDSLGELLPDARVAVGRRPVPYDAATHTYRRAKAGHAGVLAVTYGGRTTYHALKQTMRPRTWDRVWRRVVFGFPLGYATRPVYQLGRGVRHFSSTTDGLVGLLRSPFDEDVRDSRQQTRRDRRKRRWASYVVFSQPRYRPTGDTLRLKARVLRWRTGRLYSRPLTIWLSVGYKQEKLVATLHPVRPGSYEYTMPLADTLNLRADSYAQIYLKDTHEHELLDESFRVEDYELTNAHYTLRVAEKEQRHGQPQAVYLRGTDANDLPLPEARVRLAVLPQREPGPLRQPQLFIADTLWTHPQTLDPVGETRINLPASIFPDVDFGYTVQATFLTADNERHVETTVVDYQHAPGRLQLALSHDSISLGYDSLGVARPHRAWLRRLAADEHERPQLPAQAVTLPVSLPLDYLTDTYELRDASGQVETLTLNERNAGLTLHSDRTPDSVLLAVDNPHRMPFWYFVYRGNALRYRGYGRAYRLAVREAGTTAWHVSLHYRWGGQLRVAEYTVGGPAQPQLQITTNQPAVAYPGQKIKLDMVVTNEHGQPVPDADLTAYAYTSKFGAATPATLPRFSRPVVGRRARRRFQLAGEFEQSATHHTRRPLPWRAWHARLGLDSLRFYQFLYPASGTFQEYRPAPGGLTQVAPFVVDSGRVRAPIAVYFDGQPAYIHDVNEDDPYAILADSGRHTLQLRLPDTLVTLRDVYLRPGHKLTLSVDVNHPAPILTIRPVPGRLSPSELAELHRTLVLVNTENQDAFTTLRQGARLRVLHRRYRYNWRQSLAGPFRPDSVLLRRADGLRLRFLFEPLFAYTLRPQLLKMVSAQPSEFGGLDGAGFSSRLPLADFALTEADVRYSLYPQMQPRFEEPGPTLPGQGRLTLRQPPSADHPQHLVAYVLLTRPDQPTFVRLSPHLTLPALPPGRYRVAALLSDSTCLVPSELITVQANGQTYLQLRQADLQPAGALSRRIGRLVRARIPAAQVQAAAPGTPQERRDPGPPGPSWHSVRGRVLDADSDQGVAFATILVNGTTIGSATAADGSFTLLVPPGSTVLTASFIGYETEEQPINFSSDIFFRLRIDARQLGEVVVTGALGIQRQVGYATATLETQMLAGKVAGVQVQSTSGYIHTVTLRGTRSVTGENQALIVIDGVISTNQDLAALNPDDIANTNVLKGAAAAALYGTQAANGALIITTKGNAGRLPRPGQAALPIVPEVPIGDPRLALRRRFRDYAWWRPTLSTDAQGRAHTEVVLPDDVTSWDTFVLGSDNHRRMGSATGRLRSFKGLLAELAGPRFLVAGDQTQVIGKVLNYKPDTAQVTTTFQLGTQVLRTQARRVSTSVLDTLTITAPATGADSVQVTFGLTQLGGYADGEQRSIAVLPAGTREQLGTFAAVTATDTTVYLPLDPKLGEVTVRLESDALPTLLAEIRHVQQYPYLCNEQLASKLLTLLLEQRIRTAQHEPFKGQRAVNALIRQLQQNRHQPNGTWGTWPSSEPSPWVTAHALEALLAAEKAGFKVDINRTALQAHLLRELDERLSVPAAPVVLAVGQRGPGVRPTTPDADVALRYLRLLHQLGATTDYRTYLDRLDQTGRGRPPLDRYLASVELRQQLKLPYQLDSLRRYRLCTELGGVFYADTARAATYYRYLLADRVGTTLIAYRVLHTQGGHEGELVRLRTFLLGLRGGGYWGSTYEAAQLLATIGPDLLTTGNSVAPVQVQLSGAPAATAAGSITKFPFDLKLPAPEGPLTLHKTGGLPVYATAYQTRWNPTPEAAAKPFTVTTTLAGQTGRRVSLRAGQPAELVVTVEAKAEARYVLLEVPIPAGCSYGPTPQANSLEVHRENLRHQTGIFIDQLPIGKQVFRVALLPRYRGQYTLNPARAELVYFPTKYGRTGSKQVGIQ